MTVGAAAAIGLRPAAEEDRPPVARWPAEPHVREGRGDPQEELAPIAGDIGAGHVAGSLATLGGAPFGSVEAWDPRAFGLLHDQPAGTRGIDPFIGAPAFLGRGLGAGPVRAMAERLFEGGVPRVVIDPDPADARAIRACERSGSRALGVRVLAGDAVLLMARDRPTESEAR